MHSPVRTLVRLSGIFFSLWLLSLSADVFAQRAPKPDFSAMSCDQRWDTLLKYWAAEQRKKKDPCTEARERVEAQRDLMVAAGVCPGVFTVDPADIGRYESWEQESCSATAQPSNPPAAGSSQCPATVRVEQREESVLTSIRSFGSAKAALAEARLLAKRDPSNAVYQKLVAALECHAAAEEAGDQTKAKDASAQAKAKDKDSAEKSKSAANAPGGNAGRPSSGAAGAGKKSSKPVANGGFPTPHCEFLSDKSLRHTAGRKYCFKGEAYVCRSLLPADPKEAWQRVSGGCTTGGGDDVVVAEDQLRQLMGVLEGLSE